MYSDDIAIRVNNISKYFEIYDKPSHRLLQMLYRGRKQFFKPYWALRDISFEVKRGECVGIIGRNGAGKSTLLQIVTGTLAPSSGSVELNGRVAALLELGSGFNPEFTGRENVYLNAALLGLSKEETDAKYQEILQFADIGDFVDQPVKTYSSGMVVRLAFAVQVMVEPEILIVDEALAVGDIRFQKKCFQYMEKLCDQGTTLFLVTHDLEQVKKFCSYVYWLEGGMIREHGIPREVTENYTVFMQFEECSVKKNFEITNKVVTKDRSPLQQQSGSSDLLPIPGNVLESTKGGTRITHYGIFDSKGKNIQILDKAQKLTCVFLLDITSEIKAPYLGFALENLYGTAILGINTFCLEKKLDPIAAGCRYRVEFKFFFPELQNGDYFFMFVVSDGVQHDQTRLHKVSGIPFKVECRSLLQEQLTVVKLQHCTFKGTVTEK